MAAQTFEERQWLLANTCCEIVGERNNCRALVALSKCRKVVVPRRKPRQPWQARSSVAGRRECLHLDAAVDDQLAEAAGAEVEARTVVAEGVEVLGHAERGR